MAQRVHFAFGASMGCSAWDPVRWCGDALTWGTLAFSPFVTLVLQIFLVRVYFVEFLLGASAWSDSAEASFARPFREKML